MKIKILFHFIVPFLFSFIGIAQADSTFKNPHGEPRWADVKLIVGTWISEGTPEYAFTFIDEGHEIRVGGQELRQELMSYSFMKNEKGQFYSTGYLSNWPPYNMDILIIDENTIDIFNYHHGYNGDTKRFIRKL